MSMKWISIYLLVMIAVTCLSAQEKLPNTGDRYLSDKRTAAERSSVGQTEVKEKPFQYNSAGHVHFTTGICQHGYTHVGVGGGGEGFLWRGLTLGGSAGYHQFVDDVGFGLASLDVGYHFTDRKTPKRFDPFVNVSPMGGFFSAGRGVAVGVGGGVNYWFKERLGLRTEARLQVLGAGETLVMFRIGLNFR